MNQSLSTYLAQDRLRALARSEMLPDHTRGSALFADISGFTPLTEELTQQFGARRGIEQLTQRINTVYDALIRVVEQCGGSVISFAGDAIICWFDAALDQASVRSVSAALGIQAAMRAFPDLSLKVAVTSGDVRRFVAGDPQIQLLDTLAGETIARLAIAEHLAQQGEILADIATIELCGEVLRIQEWRADVETNKRFAVIDSLSVKLEDMLASSSKDIPSETLRSWIPPTVYAREQSGLGEFLTELRPAVALFLNFSGIDYDGDEFAGQKLDAFIQRVQHVVARYDGTLLQLTIGDKGSYLYVCFGAPTAHEDDCRRAVRTALALRELPRELTFLQPVQIGISLGTLRVGAAGSTTRRTYGALGDEANLAARLMSLARPNEIVVSERVQQLLGDQFTLEPRLPVTVKGKTNALNVFAVTNVQRHRATRLLEPMYRLPMIGRLSELDLIVGKLELVHQGHGQIIGITAEAGMGKSRLVAETIRLAQRQGFVGYGGACESSGTNSAYLVWKAIWQAFFDVDPTAPARRQLRQLEGELQDRAPHRLQAMPLLAPILDLQIDDNDFTRTLEPKDRRNALEALLEDSLKAVAKEEPILFVLEDVHWIDPLSHDLLESLARATTNAPVCFVLAYRPPELERLQAPRVEALPNFTKITLNELTANDAEQLIRAKLAALYPERGGSLPKNLVEPLTTKAQGNPFFIEELLNYLHDRGIDLWGLGDPKGLLELPSSLHTLILSRVDQLSETQKATLKVASIIGRLFPFAWLHGYYPTLGAPEAVKADLNVLERLDITPLDTPEPELAYLFKHIVTQEVAYESLAYATRTQLHEQLAQYLEARDATKYLDLLAFHYGRSENVTKQKEYFRKAGEAAQAAYANTTALDYYERLLPLLNEPGERVDLQLRLGGVVELLGRYSEAERSYLDVLAQTTGDVSRTARCQFALGRLYRLRGDYEPAQKWLGQARQRWEALQDRSGLGKALIEIGLVFSYQGKYAEAWQKAQGGLALARTVQDKAVIASGLNVLGSIAGFQGDFTTARGLYEESLALRREMSDKRGIAKVLYNLAIDAEKQGDSPTMRVLYKESLALAREIGDKQGVAAALYGVGYGALLGGDYAMAGTLCEESLALCREMGHKAGVANALGNLGLVAYGQGNYAEARRQLGESLRLFFEIGHKDQVAYDLIGLAGVMLSSDQDASRAAQMAGATEALLAALGVPPSPFERGIHERTIAAAKATLGEAAFNAAFEAGHKMTLEEAVQFALEER